MGAMDTTTSRCHRCIASRVLLLLSAVGLLAGCGGAAAAPVSGPAGDVSPQAAAVRAPIAATEPVPATPTAATARAAAEAAASPATPGLPPHVVIVKRGDTLWGIAREHHVPLSVVLAANPEIRNPSLIHPGQRIEIPSATVLADAAITPSGGTGSVGRVRTTMVIPTAWAEVPGTFRFDGRMASVPASTRGVAEQMGYWFDSSTLDARSGGARVASVTGPECQYWDWRAPTCRDVDWIFVDAVNPSWPDSFAWCTWADGRRPDQPADPFARCDETKGAGASRQWFTVTGGSLQVVVNPA